MIRNALVATLLITALSGCLQTENSNSLDAGLYGDGGGTPEFVAAMNIIGTNCGNCHAYSAQTEDDLISQGLVVPGDPENSPLFFRLIGSSGTRGPKTMPTSGGALDASDMEAIAQWITIAN